jgi:predicted deacylase
MNRVFPDGDGSPVTVGVVRKVWELASSSDYVLDLHCAGHYAYQYILSLYRDFGHARSFVDNIDWGVAIMSSGLRGQLFVEATHIGIPAAIIETAGGSGYYIPRWGDILFKTLLGTLNNLGILEFDDESGGGKRYYGRLRRVSSERDGFFNACVELGEDVVKGSPLGEVEGYVVKSPVSGIVLGLSIGRYVFKGGYVARVAERGDE